MIETPRLRLRRHRLDDFAASAAMWADPTVVKFIGGKPSTEQQAWARFLNYAGHWEIMGFGYWMIEEKSSGQFIGEVGFADFKREIEPSIQGLPELGWALVSKAHGKGYATEAVQAALEWGEKNLTLASRAVCIISPENEASIRVAGKCGFQEVQKTTYLAFPTIMFSRNFNRARS